ncbi:nucleotide exchange factor GrpE, partial [Deinococcus wulumuqiensis]|uniref:nucleotide exchange factor GrpE n=1 Tax=Deinococcus wulumuqiensis TaxID=980427 RepID=UPI00242EF613
GKEGETFDPQWHEAIQVVEGNEDEKIVQTYQLGFKMGDKLVRPARVVVSRKG